MSTGVRSEYSSINRKSFRRTVKGIKGEPPESPLAPLLLVTILKHFRRPCHWLLKKGKSKSAKGKSEATTGSVIFIIGR
jgi:hypothetical protein